ncbi:hypothetical protein BBJ28_00023918 [Nothophytophthora sp. Chile5]|nr:hypothetical protein BBJ28_00023918 [Nothophytophthora sp. Chile5]
MQTNSEAPARQLKRCQRPGMEPDQQLAAAPAAPSPGAASPNVKAKARRTRQVSRRVLSNSSSTASSSSASSVDAASTLASAPRTVEILWSGQTAPGFTLKRKRTGAILVSTVTPETHAATTLRAGSELKLVGGFPVNRLTLKDVKKVMLLAPKPVSLVFVNCGDVVLRHNGSFVVESSRSERGSLINEFAERKLSSTSTAGKSSASSYTRSMSLDFKGESSDDSDSDKQSTMSAPAFYSKPSESNKSKKRKVSKLQVALDRMSQLLNRPVRQAGLHVAAGKSIVV